VHNLLPRVDRRVLSLGIGALVTVLGLLVKDFSGYYGFLSLIGAVFVPLSAVLAVDFFFGAGRGQDGWNMAQDAPTRWVMLLPWAVGFAVYQLIAPAALTGWGGWWPAFWGHASQVTGVHATFWTSASLFSFLAAGLLTFPLALRARR
jgi:purine-cytosine permease-like protein